MDNSEVISWEWFEALRAQWKARRALIEHTQRHPFSDVERTRLALELSKAEAELIALEDAQ